MKKYIITVDNQELALKLVQVAIKCGYDRNSTPWEGHTAKIGSLHLCSDGSLLYSTPGCVVKEGIRTYLDKGHELIDCTEAATGIPSDHA